MKITGHVIEVEDCGDDIRVTAQGKAVAAASWVPLSSIIFRIPATDKAKRTYHLGRDVVLEITPS